MRYRILESTDGRFYPQFKPGFLWRWRCFRRHADTMTHPVRMALIEERDPAKAAGFGSKTEASAFIDRVDANADAGLSAYLEREVRVSRGIDVRQVHEEK